MDTYFTVLAYIMQAVIALMLLTFTTAILINIFAYLPPLIRSRIWRLEHPDCVKLRTYKRYGNMKHKVFYHSVNGKKPVVDVYNSLYLDKGENIIYLSFVAADWNGGLCTFPKLERELRYFRYAKYHHNTQGIINFFADAIRYFRATLPKNRQKGICLKLNVREGGKYEWSFDCFNRSVTVKCDYYETEDLTYDTEHIYEEITAVSDTPIRVEYMYSYPKDEEQDGSE